MALVERSGWLKSVAVVSSCFYLAACGGGSSSSSASNSSVVTTPVVVNHAEGLYLESNTVRLQKINLLIKDNVLFGLAGAIDSSGQMFAADGVFAGLGSSANGTYSANLNYFSSNVLQGTLTALDGKLNSLSGTLTVGGVSQSLTADAPSSAAYTYARAASLQDVQGDWTLNRSVKLTVSSSGFISGYDGACLISGVMLPDTSKNFFAVGVTYSKMLACGDASGLEAKGLAASYLLSNGKRQLIIMMQGVGINAALGMAGVR